MNDGADQSLILDEFN